MNKSNIPCLDDMPKHWGIKKLKYIAKVQFSNVDKNSNEDEMAVHLCNYMDVYANDFITGDMNFMNATASNAEIDKFHLEYDDVLVTKDSESWLDIAVPALVKGNYSNVLCGYHLAQIRPNPEYVFGEYLLRAFQSRGINDQFCIASNGVTRFGLGKYWLDNGVFPMPPLEEQRAIACFLTQKLSETSIVIEKKRQQIELLQEKRTALIRHVIAKGLNSRATMKNSGMNWQGTIPEHWGALKLRYIADIQGGCTPNKSNEQYWQGDIPWVSPKDMKTRYINDSEDHVSELALDETSLRLLQPPVVLIVVRGMILAHTFPVGVTTIPVTINQDMKALRPKKGIVAEYLSFLLEGISDFILSQVDESAHGTKCLRSEIWENIKVFIPDELEQKAICTYLHDKTRQLELLVEQIQKSIDMLYEYRTALISAAVIGKVTF